MSNTYRVSKGYRAYYSGYKNIENKLKENKLENLNLIPVIPIQDHGYNLEVFSYQRIKVELLDQEYIKRIYELQNAKQINILETPNFFLIQYPNRPIIFVNRTNGRLYVLEGDGFNKEEKEQQASFVIRMLHKFNQVEDLHSKRIGRKFRSKEFREEFRQYVEYPRQSKL